MSKSNVTLLLGTLITLLLSSARTKAGDIDGVLAVSHPDQAVVYVEKVPGAFQGERVEMDQQNKVFIPFVLPVVQGTTVEFNNSDDLTHNVFGVGDEEFNLGNWTKGIRREHTFNKLGEVSILCNVHPEMEAYILVLQNPYFAHPASSGKFRIGNVPAGEYTVRAWYRSKTKKLTVKVPSTGNVTATF